jgi:chromosome segregation ATPase
MRTIIIKEINAIEFKNHKSLDLVLGTVNTIKGINGEGKTSIGEIFSWVLGGVDMMGWSKFDPTPTDRKVDKVFGSVLLQVDDKEIKFSRELIKGKAGYYINDVPKKAKEFTELVYSLTGTDSIDLLLSLFNPSYFPAMHWQDQRNMVMKHVTAPANSEVYKDLPMLQAAALKEAFKKHNVTDLDALHKKNKVTKEKELIAAKATLQTLEGQLNTVVASVDTNVLQEELESLKTELTAHEDQHRSFTDFQNALTNKNHRASSLLNQIEKIKQKNADLKAQVDCPACKQVLSDETKQNVKDGLTAEYKPLVAEYKKLTQEIDFTSNIPDWNFERVKAIQVRISAINESIRSEQSRIKAVEVIDAARTKVEEVQASLNESIFLLDAIKAFNGKLAELQAEKVKGLFKTLSIRLWTTPKEGDKTPAFEIEMNGKPYSKLSLGERTVAGLELIGVLMEQSEVFAPVFVDNSESVTRSITSIVNENTPQVIAAYAVPKSEDYDGTLKVEVQ